MLLGFKVSSISMNLFGFSTELYSYKLKKSYMKIITYLAGPIFNLLCVLVFYYSRINNELALKIIYTNFLLCILNLLPIMPLDGGKILKEVLKAFVGNKDASIIMSLITKAFLITISAVYSIAILKMKNIAILLLIIYLWYLYSVESRKVSTLKRVYEIIEKS